MHQIKLLQISIAITMKGTDCRLGPPVVQSDTDIQTAQQFSWHRQLYCSNVNVG